MLTLADTDLPKSDNAYQSTVDAVIDAVMKDITNHLSIITPQNDCEALITELNINRTYISIFYNPTLYLQSII